jgi:hypothetical protein
MPELVIRVDLPDALALELEQASRRCDMSPAAFCASAVESVIAARRLSAVTAAKHGARLPGYEPHTPEPRERGRARGLTAADVPTVDDLDTLADIV